MNKRVEWLCGQRKQSQYLRSECFYRFPDQMRKAANIYFVRARTGRARWTPVQASAVFHAYLTNFPSALSKVAIKVNVFEKIAIRRLHILALVMPSARIDKTIFTCKR